MSIINILLRMSGSHPDRKEHGHHTGGHHTFCGSMRLCCSFALYFGIPSLEIVCGNSRYCCSGLPRDHHESVPTIVCF